MLALLCFGFAILALPFKSKIQLEAENTALRHQLIVVRGVSKLKGTTSTNAVSPALSGPTGGFGASAPQQIK
jgi:hypothetical protein